MRAVIFGMRMAPVCRVAAPFEEGDESEEGGESEEGDG
jgi:hypothetical protein